MAKTKPPSSVESDLVSALDRVGDELQLVRQVLDEIRTDFQWAIQNGRIMVRGEQTNANNTPPIVVFDEGDGVELEIDGETVFGEVVAVNDGINQATVQLIPSHRKVTVRQDDLRRVEPDVLARQAPPMSIDVADLHYIPQPVGELPEPGNLF